MKQVPFGPVRFDVMQLKRKDRAILKSIEENQEELDNTLTSVSGNPIAISDASNTNAEGLTATLSPTQAGTGDPSPDNVRPISGVNPLTVNRTGKNLCPMPTFSSAIGYAVQPTNKTDIINLLNSLPAGNYTISAKFQLASRNDTSDNSVCGFAFIGAVDWTNTSWGTSSAGSTKTVTRNFTKTDSMTCTAVYFYGCGNNTDGATGTATLTEFQIELGSSATPYEPYQGTAITLNLGSTVYGGSVDLTSGVLTVDKVIIDLKDQIITKTSGVEEDTNYSYQIANSDLSASGNFSEPSLFLSNVMAYSSSLPSSSGQFTVRTTPGTGYLYFNIGELSPNTVEQCKTSLTSLGAKLVYPLATPTTAQLTPQELRLLTGNNTIWSNGDTISFSYQPDNLIGELKAWVLDQLS